MNQKKFKFIDLFAGIGGFHRALTQIGGECVLAVEFDKDCEKVYRSSFPETKFISNIREITREDIEDENSSRTLESINQSVPDHDLLCAGFPCQPFSIAGKGHGFSDKTRGTLFFDIVQILKAKRPEYVILENVRNLVSSKHTDTWKTIIKTLRDLGYSVSEKPTILSPHLIPKEHGGAPQVRDRVFIMARKGDHQSIEIDREPFKNKGHDPFYDWKIADYLIADSEISNIKNYRVRDEEKMWFDAWNDFAENVPTDSIPTPIWLDALKPVPKITKDMAKWRQDYLRKNSQFYNENKEFIDQWKKKTWDKEGKITIYDFPPSRQKFEFQARRLHKTKEGRTIRNLVMQMRQSGLRVKPANYLPALVAITQTSIIGPDVHKGIKEFRRITPNEAAKLQGIDGKIFVDAGVDDAAAYKQLGNGVNVGVVKFVACQLLPKTWTNS